MGDMKGATMRRAVAVALILALGIVGGAAINQVGQADAGYHDYDRQIVRELKSIKRELGAIKYNTGAVCQDASAGFSCKKF